MSMLLNEQQILKWSVPEKECYAILVAFKKFEYLIRDCFFVLHTDHKNLVFLDKGTGRVLRWKLFIQEHSFEIQYIEGPNNIVADDMSRELVRPDVLTTAVTSAEQSENQIEYLNLLYAAVPPSREQRRLFDSCHNDVVGHSGHERTMLRLRNAGHVWRYQRQHVRDLIDACDMCQKLSYVKPAILTQKYTLAADMPMNRLAIDAIGPLPSDKHGNVYIIVIICLFSRFIELCASPSVEAIEAARALLKHFGRYGAPSVLTSDRGSQFVNDLIADFLKMVGTEHVLSIAYSHQENGMIERSNRSIMNYLRAIVINRKIQTQWSECLPLVQRIHNASRNESIGVAPTQIVFGNAVNTDRGLLAGAETSQHHGIIQLSEWVDKMTIVQRDIIELARTNQREADLEHLNPSPKRVRTESVKAKPAISEFPIGDFVLVSYPENAVSGRRPPHKLMAQLKGPYKVINSVGSAYTIQNLVTNKLETVHITQLHPYRYDPNETDPRQTANLDSETWDVERIIRHKGEFKSKSSLSFQVRWSGFSAEHDTWEPWSSVRNTEAMHKYLREKNLAKWIPKSILQVDV